MTVPGLAWKQWGQRAAHLWQWHVRLAPAASLPTYIGSLEQMLLPELHPYSRGDSPASAVGPKRGGSLGKARVRPAPAAHLVT